MPWEEFEGHYNPETREFSTTSRRRIKTGDEVVISERTSGLLKKRLVRQNVVKVINPDTAVLEIRRPGDDVLNLGRVADFGFAAQNFDFEKDGAGFSTGRTTTIEQVTVTRQDVFERGDKDRNRYKGVLWVNELGQRPEPVIMVRGRSYFVTDDPKDQSIPRRIASKIRAALKKG